MNQLRRGFLSKEKLLWRKFWRNTTETLAGASDPAFQSTASYHGGSAAGFDARAAASVAAKGAQANPDATVEAAAAAATAAGEMFLLSAASSDRAGLASQMD